MYIKIKKRKGRNQSAWFKGFVLLLPNIVSVENIFYFANNKK
ncbi:hypothetical protein B4168_0170 [Anoxybacillus flavithermus]|nr:hypothetical protein B4168_0170 [Anoxybacillus flavithermus]OAO88908.1 hypothetical protein GT23_0148 [Parageobacillus thermoglucosidasius]